MAHLGYDTTVIPRATTVALWNSVLWNILEPEHLGPGKCMRQRAHLGLCSGRTPGHLAWEEQEMYGSTGTGISENTQESEQLRPGKCRRQRTHLGLCPGRDLGSLDWLGLGRVGHTWLTWDWPFIEHLGTWAWEVHEIHGPPVTVPSWSIRSVSGWI